ncbi:fatty acid desaturase [uncultured Erythrobacter sp.]|uniref:fatty acid desaturase n=1 Tax=uncultured Erythrobacter sp. TaxID=263913 RepID=UPI002612547A|nr:fatty acid desaturase [uncultured Erythrobacter sp.]
MTHNSQGDVFASQSIGGEVLSTGASASIDASRIVKSLVAFRTPSVSRSWYELSVTFVPFLVVFAIMMFAVSAGHYLALLLTPLSGLLLLRMFIIQHDCGHGSFMPGKKKNDWIGRAIGVLTLTPYDCWRRSHDLHHAGTGNLDARGFGDVDTLTVREFQSLSPLKRFGYRLYRHPLTMLGFGPAYLFLLRHRLPIGLMRAGPIYWLSAMATNVATGLLLAVLAWQFGLDTTMLVFLPTLLFAATTGVWLFYVQHQFESAHWDARKDWSFKDAALHGSSYLDLPAPLRWFTGGIGIHHIHHLMSRIPFYRLIEALDAHPELANVNRITARQTIRPFLLALWDEDQRKMVRFRDI